MNILITGGAGFIGSHLAQKLIKEGHKVYAVDDLSTGREGNIEDIKDNPLFSFTRGSVLNASLMEELIGKCELVYHLAAAVGVEYIMSNRSRTILVNVMGTHIVLEAASRSSDQKKKVMIASSSEVYGKNGSVPFSENDDSVLGPTTVYRWSYADTKRMDENFALSLWYEKKLPVVIMRLFNTVGPRQLGRYGMVVPRFIKRALSKEPLQVYGNGKQTRCFTYIGDVVEAMIGLAFCEEASGRVFNIGSEEEISIKDLAKKIIKLTGSSSEIEYISYEKAYGEGFEDMKRRVPDISKIKRVIGWQPKVGLDELLKKMIAYEREQLDKKESYD